MWDAVNMSQSIKSGDLHVKYEKNVSKTFRAPIFALKLLTITYFQVKITSKQIHTLCWLSFSSFRKLSFFLDFLRFLEIKL